MSNVKFYIEPQDGKTYEEICDEVENGVTHTIIFRGVKFVKPKEGYWWHCEGMLICSECGTEYYDDIMEYTGDEVPEFCPHCGADMREESQ